VNDDLYLTPADVLLVVNWLNAASDGIVSGETVDAVLGAGEWATTRNENGLDACLAAGHRPDTTWAEVGAGSLTTKTVRGSRDSWRRAEPRRESWEEVLATLARERERRGPARWDSGVQADGAWELDLLDFADLSQVAADAQPPAPCPLCRP
jgi:hypothetical protein